ncbi:putative membrane-bound spermidine synthase [Lactobacillus colini]|uniref:Membrane-bound spermidine synthase n=1 Tax=Lactobacillus colini TaxID=1819254 RepID=A0ABS4MCI5_9LACO|nr:putative membrane-bound spermidine synthase [Lactobacillus colini]
MKYMGGYNRIDQTAIWLWKPLDYLASLASPLAWYYSFAYAISYDREAVLTSNSSLISTVSAVVMIPIWIAILEILNNAGIL